jgi:Ca2+-binding EF-hand superfamily protein
MKYPVILTIAASVLAASPALSAPHEGNAFIHDYDADHDGSVSRAEFDAGRTTRFKATDTNGDGWVSEDEYVAEYSARLEEQLKSFDRGEEKKVEERQRQIRQTHVRFGVLDKDKDARMTKAEYDVSGARAFAEQDDDKDGKVSATDVAATAARRAAELAKRDQ